MDASIVDIASGINVREPSRKAASPAPGFERHFADERPPAAPPERTGPVARQRPEEKLRPREDQEQVATDVVESGQIEPAEGACCLSDIEEPAAPQADLSETELPLEPGDELILDTAAIMVAAVVDVALVTPQPVLDLASLGTETVAPVAEAKPTSPEATNSAEPALDAALAAAVLPAGLEGDATRELPISGAEPASAAPEIKVSPAQIQEEEQSSAEEAPGVGVESATEEPTDRASEAGGVRSPAAKVRKSLLAEGDQDESSPELAPAPPEAGPAAAAQVFSADAPPPESDAASASDTVGDEGPVPVTAHAAEPRASDAAPPTPLSSRLPAHLVGRGERTEQTLRGHDAEQVRLLQRVARAFETAHARDGELRIKLSPPELGSLRLEIKVQEGVMTARLEAETPEAKAMLLDNLSALRERLAEQNMKIDRFDVELMDRNTQGHANQPQEEHAPTPPRNAPPRDAEVGLLESDSIAGPLTVGPGKLNVVV